MSILAAQHIAGAFGSVVLTQFAAVAASLMVSPRLFDN
jgi:hypothetical protein